MVLDNEINKGSDTEIRDEVVQKTEDNLGNPKATLADIPLVEDSIEAKEVSNPKTNQSTKNDSDSSGLDTWVVVLIVCCVLFCFLIFVIVHQRVSYIFISYYTNFFFL